MIILLDTSTPVCKLTMMDGDESHEVTWEAGRTLADGLLSFLENELAKQQNTLHDISGIGVYRGPGSFTGLRIGMTVVNTIASSEAVPIVGETGGDWKKAALSRLKNGDNDNIVLPMYGGEANITTPRK